MDFGDTKPTLLSLLGGIPQSALIPGMPDRDVNGQSSETMQQQALRAELREEAMNRYFPPQQPVDNTAMLPLLQILAHGSIPAMPMGSVQMPPPDPMQQQGQPQQPPQQGAM